MADDREEVWQATVDSMTWEARVVRTDAYQGELIVTKIETGKVISTMEVSLSFDAIFGPDVADVAEWQSLTIETIDRYEKGTLA